MEKIFTVRGAIREARAVIKPKFWSVIGQYAVIMLTVIVLSAVSSHNLLLSLLISSVVSYMTTGLALGYATAGMFRYGELFKSFTFQKFAYFFLAVLVAKFLIIGGFILLVIPGIILSIMLCFVQYIAFEREIGPIDACKESARLTHGNRWNLFKLFLVIVLINILGAVCLLVGLLYTIPLSAIALALVYKKLHAAKDFVPEIVSVIETEDGTPVEIVDAVVTESSEA